MTDPRRSRHFGNNLRSWRGWRSADRDVREEMALHVDLRARDLEATGLSAVAARAQAEREVGDHRRIAPQVRALATATDRSSAGAQWIDEMRQDVRHALRMFRRAPAFTTTILLTIALGLGANVAMFGVVNAAYFAPLPFDPDNTLVRVREFRTGTDGRRQHVDASRRTADAAGARPDLFSQVVPISGRGAALGRDGGAMRVQLTRVGPGFTTVLGFNPTPGRTFTADEERHGEGSGVALISRRLWEDVFGGRADIAGGRLQIDGRPFTVVGVLPDRFHVPYRSDVWIPSRFGEDERSIFILARLAPGVSVARAQAELEPIGQELARQYPQLQAGLGVTAISAREHFVGDDDRVAMTLMGAVGFLLLIVCANVALLLTTRYASRQEEIALRAALGCGRGRQIRLFLTESVLMFLIGGALGVVAAVMLRGSLAALVPEDLLQQTGIAGIPIDLRFLSFAAVLSLLSGLLFGGGAALRAGRANAATLLRGSSRAVGKAAGRRTLAALVVAEVALALALLTGAAVVIDAFRQVQQRDLGVDPEGVTTLRVDLNGGRLQVPAARDAFLRDVLTRARTLPGVEAAGATSANPFCCGDWGIRITPEGFAPAGAGQTPIVQHFLVTPGYFDAMRQPLLEGRTFTAADVAGAQMVAVVDRAFADRFWPGQSAVGKRVKRGTLAQTTYPWLTIVGVVGAVEEDASYTESWYLPYAQHADGPSATSAHLMVRTTGQDAGLVPAMRAIVAQIDPGVALYEVSPVADLIANERRQDRLGTIVTTLFAIAGALLAALALYGAMAFVVGQDAKEIGIRIALGASRADVVLLIARRAMAMVAIGLAAGAAGSWFVARGLQSVIDIARFDGSMIAGAGAVLLLAASAATLVPIRRALKLDPLAAVRAE